MTNPVDDLVSMTETIYNKPFKWKTRINTPCPLLAPCSSCKKLLPIVDFYKLNGAKAKRRDITGVNRTSKCPACNTATIMSRPLEIRLYHAAKKRAALKNIPFDIEVSDIVVPTYCPILGIPLYCQEGVGAVPVPERYNSPSLDRINNKKGYVKGNIAVISMRANQVKSDGTYEEIAAIAAFMKQHLEAKQ